MSPGSPQPQSPTSVDKHATLAELISLASKLASDHGHVLKPWSLWPGTKFHLAECQLCGANAIADPTFRSYELGTGGGAVQFQCRSAHIAPRHLAETHGV